MMCLRRHQSLFFLLEEFAGVRYLYLGEHGTHFPSRTELSIPRQPIVRRAPTFPLERANSMSKHPYPGNLRRYHWGWEVRTGAGPNQFLVDKFWSDDRLLFLRGAQEKWTSVAFKIRHWQPGQWHHVAATWSPAELRLFIAKFWRRVLLPVIERYRRVEIPKFFRGK
jgi:hypothetical protein